MYQVKNVIFFSFLFLNIWSFGQSEKFKAAFECGGFVGGGYYIGDINPNKHFIYSKPAYGGIIRYNLSTRHSIRLTGVYGNIQGNDAQSSDPWQINRNLSFTSRLIEIAAGFEVCLKKYSINKTHYKFRYTPYFFYELAYLKMSPKLSGTGNVSDIELQEIGTEGQGSVLSDQKSYSANQFTVPLGIGFKFNLAKRLAMSIEYGVRLTFTDYLDDVSGDYIDPVLLNRLRGNLATEIADPSLNGVAQQYAGANRGNANNKDWYAFYGVMITFKPWKRNICEFGGSF